MQQRIFPPNVYRAIQFAGADTMVVAAPHWDLMFTAAVKGCFEAVTVNGITFEYGETGIFAKRMD